MQQQPADVRTLADPVEVQPDLRPRFLWIATPEGTRRIRRMPPPQLFTQIRNFERLKLLDAGQWHPAATDQQAMELSRFLQRCLVRLDADILSWPGEAGLRDILTWSLARRNEIAEAAAKFMEI